MRPSKLKPRPEQIYHMTFEEYLQPKKTIQKSKNKLQFQYANMSTKQRKQLQLKLLEHPVLNEKSAYKKIWQKSLTKIKMLKSVQKLTTKRTKIGKTQIKEVKSAETTFSKYLLRVGQKFPTLYKTLKLSRLLKLANLLAFLRARNDDGLCKRKTGFEIYCELTSVHGFINFVGAKTWQRVFWCSTVCLAIAITIMCLVMSHRLNVDTPTILYTESTTYPAWTIPFPAITICNLNRISRIKAEAVVKKLSSEPKVQAQILGNLRFLLYTTDILNATEKDFRFLQLLLNSKNYTHAQLLREIAPSCNSQLLRCKWRSRLIRCEKIFHKIETPEGLCCAFNYHLVEEQHLQHDIVSHGLSHEPEQTTSCGYKNGLTLLLDPQVEDYFAARTKTPGYQVLIHDAFDYPEHTVPHLLLHARTETSVSITPQTTYASEYLSSLSVRSRRCYFAKEHKLQVFRKYTQKNCLAECRSKMLFEHCGCVPPLWARIETWPICGLEEATCILKNQDIFSKITTNRTLSYKTDHYASHFICDCYPECNFNLYNAASDAALLNRSFSLGDKRFFKGIQVKNQILVHVFYGALLAERLRLDVYENWLTYVATFGGIAGLFMGYSFVSAFEMIFFVFVRPACNWLTKKQIRYRIKRRQKKAAAAAKKAKEAKEKLKREQLATLEKAQEKAAV